MAMMQPKSMKNWLMQRGNMHCLSVQLDVGLLSSKTGKRKLMTGCPREAVTQEKIAKVQELITNDPHITTQILEDEVGISHDRIVYILHNELNLHKVCAKWIPYKLSADHKKNEWKFRSNCWKYSKKAIITSLLGMKHGCISSPFRAKKAIRFG